MTDREICNRESGMESGRKMVSGRPPAIGIREPNGIREKTIREKQ
jgi:hypothetical protein